MVVGVNKSCTAFFKELHKTMHTKSWDSCKGSRFI